MPEKVIEHITWGGTIEGGPFDQHRIRVSANREGRKYVPEVRVVGPDGFSLPANPLAIPAATMRVSKDTARGALDVGFKTLYFYLNNEVAAARIADVQEESKHYTYLDDSGKRDQEFLNNLWDTEGAMAKFQDEEFPYDPPQSEAVLESGMMTMGSSMSESAPDGMDDAASMSGQDKGTEEDGGKRGTVGGPTTVDGNAAADKGLQEFLKSESGLNPELSSSQATGTQE